VGLQVRQTGPSAVTVEEGLAIDVQGRMLALAAQGHRPGQPGQAFVHTTSPENLVNVPVAVGLEGLADGVYYLTIALATTFISPGEPVEGRWLPQEQRIVSTPLLTLQPTAGFAPDGMAVILATVTLAGGVVTQLSGADRQLVTLAAGTLVVRRGDEVGAGPVVGDAVGARIGPLATGGMHVTVPEASDKVVLQQEGNHNFQELTVSADHLRVLDGASREILHVDATQATLRLSANETAGNLIVQNAMGKEVLRLDAAGAVLRVGGDLDVEGILRGNGLVATDQLADNAVTSLKIAANATTTAQIQDRAVTTAKIASGAVTNSKIAANAISTAKIRDQAVTTSKIADGAVNLSKIASNTIPDIGIAVTDFLQHGQSVPIPTGFQKSDCIFYVALKYLLIEPNLGRQVLLCHMGEDGIVRMSDPGRVSAIGIAIAKKGGW
jgi:hypothetical protein